MLSSHMHLAVNEPTSPTGIDRGQVQLKSIYNRETRPPKSPHPRFLRLTKRDRHSADADKSEDMKSVVSSLTPLPTPVTVDHKAKHHSVDAGLERAPSRGRMPSAPESSMSGSTAKSKKNTPVISSLRATRVEYRRLGKSGLHVSVPILGTMSMGSPEWQNWILTEDESLPILKEAYDAGLNTWDTANVYSNGLSEVIIGKALKVYEIPRHKVIIMTKCNGYVGHDPSDFTIPYGGELRGAKDYVNQGGLSRGAIFNQVEESLRRLGTDYIDLLQIHRFDDRTPIEETMQALNDVVRMGKVRYIGASSMWCWQFSMMQFCAEKNGWTKFISMQNHFNLLYREEEREMNRFCKATGVGIIPWSPLCRGHLARPPSEFGMTPRSEGEVGMDEVDFFKVGRTDADMNIIQRVREVADKRGWKMSHVALSWINHQVTSPIVGINSIARLEEILLATGKELTHDERRYLEELYVPRRVQGH